MSNANIPKIELIHNISEAVLWDETAVAYRRALKGQPFHPPRWIVADGRHRQAAEKALLQAGSRFGLPTGGICTLASLAGDILGWPVQTALASPIIAILTLADLLTQNPPQPYLASSDKPGFATSFWSAVVQAESFGHFPFHTLPNAKGMRPAKEFLDLQCRLHEALARQHLSSPGKFLFDALAALRSGTFRKSSIGEVLFIGPLFELSVLDRAFIEALANCFERIFLSVPAGLIWEDWLNSGQVRDAGCLDPPPPRTKVFLARPLTPEAELDGIFAAIAEWVARGEFHYQDFRLIIHF